MKINTKFRIWVPSEDGGGRMIYLEPVLNKYDFQDGFVISFVEKGYEEFSSHEMITSTYKKDLENAIIMQTLPEKDANGNDIYELDYICNTESSSSFKFWGKEVMLIEIGDNPFEYAGGGERHSNVSEVCGNKFEGMK